MKRNLEFKPVHQFGKVDLVDVYYLGNYIGCIRQIPPVEANKPQWATLLFASDDYDYGDGPTIEELHFFQKYLMREKFEDWEAAQEHFLKYYDAKDMGPIFEKAINSKPASSEYIEYTEVPLYGKIQDDIRI